MLDQDMKIEVEYVVVGNDYLSEQLNQLPNRALCAIPWATKVTVLGKGLNEDPQERVRGRRLSLWNRHDGASLSSTSMANVP